MKSSNGLQYLIVLLLIANLCGTFWLISQKSTSPSQILPKTKIIDNGKIIQQFDKAITAYNSGNKEDIWNIFSDFAKAQMKKDDAIKSVLSLKKMFGTIKSGMFMYQESAGEKGNLTFYKGVFRVELDNSKIGEKATLTITVSSDGIIEELIGFHLNSNT